MDWYRVIKKINGHRYYYYQKTYRVGRRVKTLNKYVGPVDKVPRPAARLAYSPNPSMNVGMKKEPLNDHPFVGAIYRNIAYLDRETLSKLEKSALLAIEYGRNHPHDIFTHRLGFNTYESMRTFAKKITGLDTLHPGESDSEYSDIYQFQDDFCENAEAILDAIPTLTPTHAFLRNESKKRALEKRAQRKFRREWDESAA